MLYGAHEKEEDVHTLTAVRTPEVKRERVYGEIPAREKRRKKKKTRRKE